jgi:hypothetical protein
MTRVIISIMAVSLIGALLAALAGAQAGERPLIAKEPKRLLCFTKTLGFRHTGAIEAGLEVLPELGRKTGAFTVIPSEDLADLSAGKLSGYDAIVFLNTTGNLPLSAEDKAALLQWLRDGGAFIGVHAATDCWYDWPEFGELIGGWFDGHPWHQDVGINVEDEDHPATRHLQDGWTIHDEIYQFKNFSRDRSHVLLSIDTTSVDVTKSNHVEKDFAIAWCQEYGEGRVFYTGLGHDRNVFEDRAFQRHWVNGIRWALRLME